MSPQLLWSLSATNHQSSVADIARALQYTGFQSLLLPVGAGFDPFLWAARLATETDQLRFLVPVLPGVALPAYFAKSIQTLHEITQGRTGLYFDEQIAAAARAEFGQILPDEEAPLQTYEFLDVLQRVWNERAVDFQGNYYQLENGGLARPLPSKPLLSFFVGSPAFEEVVHPHSNAYVLQPDKLDVLRHRMQQIRSRPNRLGLTPQIGLRLQLPIRPSDLDECLKLEVDQLILSGHHDLEDIFDFHEEIWQS